MFARNLRNARGFSLAEILIVIALLGILATVVLVNLGSSDVKAKEAQLKANLEAVRTAIDLYRSDHGFYPGGPGDTHQGLSSQQLVYKLTRYTRDNGAYSTNKNTNYKYGPYLKNWPEEPFTNTSDVTINTSTERLLQRIGDDLDRASSATGGWYYEVKSGNFCANLGQDYPDEYAHF